MNILFLTTHFHTGGITSYILTLARALSESGHEVVVASSGGNCVHDLESFGGTHVTIPIRTKFLLSWRIWASVPRLKGVIAQRNIHVIHAHTRVTQTLAAVLSRISGVPYISTCHGFFRAKWFRRMFPFWGRIVIAISAQVEAHLRGDFKLGSDDIVVIQNGIDLNKFTPVTSETRDYFKRKFACHGQMVIGIIARLSDVKGHDVLIRALPDILEAVPHVRLMIVGQGKAETALRGLVRDLKLEDHVVFYPSVHQTTGFLQVFDCFVLPSLQEGLGLSIMEAQASGLAVVASRVGGIPSLIDHGINGLLVEPNDPAMLAKAVIQVLNDAQMRQKLGRQARLKALREYDASVMTRSILDVYRRVTGEAVRQE